MTVLTVYRLLCDAPACVAAVLQNDRTPTPDGWRLIQSTDHLDLGSYPGVVRRGRTSSREDIVSGRFSLLLCHNHRSVFDQHLPQTAGAGNDRHGFARVRVSCSCGRRFPLTGTATLVGQTPSYAPERAWWRHLPEELRWYATREPNPAAEPPHDPMEAQVGAGREF